VPAVWLRALLFLRLQLTWNCRQGEKCPIRSAHERPGPIGNERGQVHSTPSRQAEDQGQRPNPTPAFLIPHCGLPDGLYYLRLTDSLICRDQRHAFDDGRGRDQSVCRALWKASR
jgi:hypothetical protein